MAEGLKLDKRNLILVGFMGSGKTSVGRLLASRTGWRFIDLDGVIVRRTGLAVAEIFRTFGEPYFRFLEHWMLKEACQGRRQVIAAGGGTICDPRNRSLMKEAGRVVCLTARAGTIRERLAGDDTRPLLTPQRSGRGDVDVLEVLLDKRLAAYREADLMVATDGMTPVAVAEEIVEKLHGGQA